MADTRQACSACQGEGLFQYVPAESTSSSLTCLMNHSCAGSNTHQTVRQAPSLNIWMVANEHQDGGQRENCPNPGKACSNSRYSHMLRHALPAPALLLLQLAKRTRPIELVVEETQNWRNKICVHFSCAQSVFSTCSASQAAEHGPVAKQIRCLLCGAGNIETAALLRFTWVAWVAVMLEGAAKQLADGLMLYKSLRWLDLIPKLKAQVAGRAFVA